MNKYLIIFVLAIFLIFSFQIQIISAAASSDDYSTDYHTGISGGAGSNSECNSEFAFMYQGTGSSENSNYNANIGIFPQPLFCGDGICNNGETCSTCSADCGCSSGYTCTSGVCTLVTTPPSGSPGGGGGGGGAVACTYDWVCSEWYPEPCPLDGIQKRVCVNRGTCTGAEKMPVTNRTCIPQIIPPSEPLFDLFVKVPVKYKWILQGQVVGFDTELINVGNATTIDVFFKYQIADENGRLIAETQETRAIGEKDKFRTRILLPENLEEGIYKVYVQINYDSGRIAIAGDSFGIVESEFDIFWRKIISFPYILIPLAILLSFIFIFILLKIRRKRKVIFRKYEKKKIPKEYKKKPIRIRFFKRLKENLEENRRRKKRKQQYLARINAQKKKERRAIMRLIFSKLFKKKEKPREKKPVRLKIKTQQERETITPKTILEPKIERDIRHLHLKYKTINKKRDKIEEKIRRKRLKELRNKIGKKS